MALFERFRKANDTIVDTIQSGASRPIDKLDKYGDNIDTKTKVWLCRAFAAIAFVIGVLYLINVFI